MICVLGCRAKAVRAVIRADIERRRLRQCQDNIKDDNRPLDTLSFVTFFPSHDIMGVAKLEFNVATGLYTAGAEEITSAVRRALTHPSTVGFVKRTIGNGEDSNSVEMPVWGMVLLGVSFYAAIIAMSLVSTNSLAS